MKVLFVSPNTERLFMPTLPLGLALVAAATRRAGHETRFLDLLAAADPLAAVRQAIAEFQPEVIALSIRNVDDQSMQDTKFLLEPVRDVVAVCRAASPAKIVVGGAGYSIFPEAALEYLGADYGVCGEGEVVFPALLERLQRGQDVVGLAGALCPRRPAHRQPGSSPRIWTCCPCRRPISGHQPIPRTLRSGSRCRPAAVARWHAATVRRPSWRARSCGCGRQPGSSSISPRWPRPVSASSTSWTTPSTCRSSYALELCRRLAELRLDLAWRCILYPHQVAEELVAAMAAAGCVEVSLGFESGCPQVLRAMNKRFQPEEVREISKRLAAHGIRRMGFLLLGGPGETKESVDESLAFAQSLGLEMLKVSVGIRLYPHTPLARQAVEEGVVSPEDDLLVPRFYIRPGLEDYIRQAQGEK